PWLAKRPALEDLKRLSQEVAAHLQEAGALADPSGALAIKESVLANVVMQVKEGFGAQPRTFAGDVLHAVSEKRMILWREQVYKINGELFERGTALFTWLALEE